MIKSTEKREIEGGKISIGIKISFEELYLQIQENDMTPLKYISFVPNYFSMSYCTLGREGGFKTGLDP